MSKGLIIYWLFMFGKKLVMERAPIFKYLLETEPKYFTDNISKGQIFKFFFFIPRRQNGFLECKLFEFFMFVRFV